MVLVADDPRAREPLAQPQQRFEALDRAAFRVDGAAPAHSGHRPFDPEVVGLDRLLQMIGDVVDGRTPLEDRMEWEEGFGPPSRSGRSTSGRMADAFDAVSRRSA